MKYSIRTFFFFLLIITICRSILVGETSNISLQERTDYQYNVTVQVTNQKLKQTLISSNHTLQKQQKWFVFVDIQPFNQVTWTDIFADIYVQDIYNNQKIYHRKSCSKQGVQLETCYISNEDFDLETQNIIVKISANQQLQVKFQSEIVFMKKAELNTCSQIDTTSLKKTQSKLIKINLKQIVVMYEEIRISLTPINRMYSGQPIHMYGSYGRYLPTSASYDFKSFYAWQMGVCIKLIKYQLLQSSQLFILVDAPQNYLFDLDLKLIENYNHSIQVKTGQFYNDIIGFQKNDRVFSIVVQNPTLNNYVRIKKYSGVVFIDDIQVTQWQQGFQPSSDLKYLNRFSHQGYLSESNFKIDKGIKNLTLFLSSSSQKQGSIYTVQAYENSNQFNWIDEASTHFSQLIEDKKAYFFSRVIKHINETLSTSEAQIRISVTQGAIFERIYLCVTEQLQKCIQSSKNKIQQLSQTTKLDDNLIQLPNVQRRTDQISQIKSINIFLDDLYSIPYNSQFKQQIIMLQVTGQKQFKENVFSIQFLNVALMDTISEHESKLDKFKQGQFKVYRFTVPRDQTIQSLIFHISYFYGFVDRFVTTQNPSGKTQEELIQQMALQPVHFYRQFQNTVQVQGVKPQQTYYLIVFAKLKSYVGIKVQVLKTLSHPTDQRNISYTTVLLSTTSPFQITFKPGQLIMFDMSQITVPEVILRGSTVLPLDMCINLNTTQLPLEPNCQNRHKLGKKYQVYFGLTDMNKKFSLYSGNNRSTHLSLSLQNFKKCFFRPMGDKIFIQQKTLKYLKLKQICIMVPIHRKGSLLVIIKSSSPLRQHAFKVQLKIGKSQLRFMTQLQTIIDKEQVDQGCQGEYQSCFINLISQINEDVYQTDQTLLTEELTVQIQYTDEPIDLVDGMSYTHVGLVSNTEPKLFKYSLYNIGDPITIVMNKLRGYFKLAAKVISADQHQNYPTLQQYEDQQKNFTFLTDKNAKGKILVSNDKAFHLYDTLILSKQFLNDSCVNMRLDYWRACKLLISVYPSAPTERIILDGKFTLNVIQHVSVLRQHTPEPGYLQTGMINFYQIQNIIENSMIVIFVNSRSINKNKKQKALYCFQMLSRFGIQQKATPQNNQYRSKQGQPELIISNAKKGTYSLAIQGIQSSQKYCDYEIQYALFFPHQSSSTSGLIIPSIKTIKKGTPFEIIMSTKQSNIISYLMYFNNVQQTKLKVLMLFQKLGQVLISIMPLTTQKMKNQFMNNMQYIESIFQPAWKDTNSVEITQTDPSYCSQCLYLIKLECIKDFSGQVIIPEQNSQIAIKQDSIVYDQLLKGQKSIYRVYASSHFEFKLSLISGQIRVKVINQKDKLVKLQKTYTSLNSLEIQAVQLQKQLSYDYNRYQLVSLEGIKDSHFIFGTIKDSERRNQSQIQKQENSQIQNFVRQDTFLTFGVSKQIALQKKVKKCLTGLMQQNPTFILSLQNITNQNPYQNLKGLEIQFWIDFKNQKGKIKLSSSKLDITKSKNSWILKLNKSNFKEQLTSGESYSLCLLNQKQNIDISIIQSTHINYLVQNSEVLVQESMNMTFIAGQDNILQINECGGRSNISISKDFSSLHTLESQIPQIRRSNSLIEFKKSGPIYLTVQSTGLLSIKWRQIQVLRGKNLGYQFYQSGSFRILSSSDPDKQLQLQILPLKQLTHKEYLKQLSPSVQSIVFEVYVQKQQLDLYQSMNCHQQLGMRSSYPGNTKDLNQNTLVKFYTFNQIKKQFPGLRYVLVSVKALLTLQNKITGYKQNYRFFYPYQELILVQTKNEQKQSSSGQISMGTVEILAGVLVLVVILLFWKRKNIKNLLRRINKKKHIPANFYEMKSQITQIDRYVQNNQKE